MTDDSIAIRAIIEEFIDGRLQQKLEPEEKKLEKAKAKLSELDEMDPSRVKTESEIDVLLTTVASLKEQYKPDTWLESAAHRVQHLQLVHFASKFSNPGAKSSSRYLSDDNRKERLGLIATSTCTIEIQPDVVGNAASLDVFKLLSLEFRGNTILKLILSGADSVVNALSHSEELARTLAKAFAGIVADKLPIESHQYAKQLFYPVDDESYHIVSPLFPSSLVHRMYEIINFDRFSDEVKEARQLRRNGDYSATGYREYLDMTIQNFGGTKPQNVSQLNSQRGGKAYLLSSCPPDWNTKKTNPPLRTASIFKRWIGRYKDLREQTKSLKAFLRDTNYNNIDIRKARARMVESICDEVLSIAGALQALDAGWSAHSSCQLSECEMFWLDPKRNDEDYTQKREDSDWQSEVASRFALWLNGQLKTDSSVFGDAEYQEWQSQLLSEFRSLPLEVH